MRRSSRLSNVSATRFLKLDLGMIGCLSTAKCSHAFGKTAIESGVEVVAALFVIEHYVEHIGVAFSFEGSRCHGPLGRMSSEFAMKKDLRRTEGFFVEFVDCEAEGNVEERLSCLREFLMLFSVECCQTRVGEGKCALIPRPLLPHAGEGEKPRSFALLL